MSALCELQTQLVRRGTREGGTYDEARDATSMKVLAAGPAQSKTSF